MSETTETHTAPEPGSPEWLRYMTASKISAVVGTSTYESRFSLWHRMAGNIAAQVERPEMEYGTYIEPVLLQWFADQHPELHVMKGFWCEQGRFGATPDGLWESFDVGGDQGLIECKTGRQAWEWADGVPPGYYDQVQWALWVTGEQVCYVVADVAMEFKEFRIEFDPIRAAYLVAEARKFLASLDAGRAPAIDESVHTYQALRELHPDIEDEDVEVPDRLARQWLRARSRVQFWEKAERKAKSRIADLLSTGRRARWNGKTLFNRQAKAGGTPYLVAGRSLPDFKEIA